MSTLHKAYLADMTPDEVEALTGQPAGETQQAAATAEELAAAAGAADDGADDTDTDDDATGAAAADGAADGTADGTDGAAADGAVTDDQAAAALAELQGEQKPGQAEPPKPYQVAADDFDTQRKGLQDQRKALIKQWGDGEISDEDYANKLDELDTGIYTVIQAQARAQTLADINAQHEREALAKVQQVEDAAMAKVATSSKAAGQIDYGSDGDACTLFDAAFSRAKADPKNAELSADQLAERAHRAVLAMRGIEVATPQPAASAPAAAPAAPAAPAKPKPVIPPTLGTMPAAAANQVANAFDETFDAIQDPDAREAAWAAMSPQQRSAQLRATLPAGNRRH